MSGNDFPNYSLIQFQNILTPFSGFCISFPPLCLALYLSLTHTLTNIQLPFFLWRDTRLLSCMTCDCYNSLYFFYGSWPLASFLLRCNNIFIATSFLNNCHVDTRKMTNHSLLCTLCVFRYTCECKCIRVGQNFFFRNWIVSWIGQTSQDVELKFELEWEEEKIRELQFNSHKRFI